MTAGEQDDGLVEATRFALRGDGVEVEFLAGASPQLRHREGGAERVFDGAELRREHSQLGTLVTATLESVPDLGDLTLTVVVPDVNLRRNATAEVTAVLVRTRHRTSIGGPALVDGALQSYEPLALEGTASYREAEAGACHDWRAIHDLEPPGPGRLSVTVRCSVPTPGHRIELRRAEPQGINLRDLLLEKLVHAPEGPVAQVVTEVDVEYGERTDARLDTVTVLPDSVSIPVQAAL